MTTNPLVQLKSAFVALLVLMFAGAVGYVAIEGWPLLDALYMTVTTISTVGFMEVHALSRMGCLFTMLLIVSGVTVLFYTVGKIAQVMFEGQFQRYFGRMKVEKQIEAMMDHYIICGYGRIGSLICKEFAARPVPFVVVENKEPVVQKLEAEGYAFIRGSATEDETQILHGCPRSFWGNSTRGCATDGLSPACPAPGCSGTPDRQTAASGCNGIRRFFPPL